MLRNLLLIPLFFLLLPGASVAQLGFNRSTVGIEAISSVEGILKGKITEKASSKPLVGASVLLPDLKRGTSTNGDGIYTIRGLSTGQYVVEVSFGGYSSIAETVTINGETTLNLSLKASVVEYENVTITGVSVATSLRRAPVQVTVFKRDDLLQANAGNLIDALARKPGISALTTGPSISKPFIRGLGYNRVVTISDGVRQEGQQWGDEHGIEVDEYSVQRVEVLRGPSSLMYGSDAMGGVLNISSFVPANEGQVKGIIQGTWNGNNRQWGTHASLAGNHNGFIWNAYGSARQSGDYQNKYDGYVLNSRFQEANFGGMMGLQKKWGYTHLLASTVNQQPGIVEGERNDEGEFLLYSGSPSEMVAGSDILKGRNNLVPYQHLQHLKITSDNSFNLGKTRLSLTVGYQQNKRKEFGEVEHPEEPKKYFDLQTLNYNLAWHLPDADGWRMSLGTNGMMQQNTNRAEELLIPDYNLADIGLYGVAQKNWEKLTFSGGLRYDQRKMSGDEMWYDGKTKFNAFERNFSNVSGAAGISYKVSQVLTLKTNISRSFRAPSVAELSSNGEHEGTERYEMGNPNLNSETSWQWDVAAELNTEHISVSISPFSNRINNFIFYQRLQTASGADSLMPNEDGDLIEAFEFRQHNANLSGLELSADLHPHPLDWLHWENSITLLRGRFTEAVDNSPNLPFIAPARWLSILRADIGANWKKLSRSYVKFEVDMASSQNNPFTGYGTETATAGYVLLNAGAGTQILHKGNPVSIIHLGLNNLANVAYQNHMSRLKYTMENAATGRTGVFNMGRNFTARIIIPFSF